MQTVLGNAMNKDLEKLVKTQSKDICDCIKNFAKGKTDKLGPGGDLESCLAADVKDKVAKACDFWNYFR